MQLQTLLSGIVEIPAAMDRPIKQISLDSQAVEAGGLFFAIKGQKHDGNAFIESAIQKGAVAVLQASSGMRADIRLHGSIPIIALPSLQEKVGLIAARYFNQPTEKQYVVGITGTNGKTSCTHYFAQALTYLKKPCGVIGTLGNGLYPDLIHSGLTTPDALNLQKVFADFLKNNINNIAMEVSSHSIHQQRIAGTQFKLGIYTQLSQDHLDYHGDMATYAAVKQSFLDSAMTEKVIINTDDEYGKNWVAALRAKKPVITYGLKKVFNKYPDVYAIHMDYGLAGIAATIHSPWGSGHLTAPLVGEFNLVNLLAVLAALCEYGVALPDALDALAHTHAVAGRMQKVQVYAQQPLVIVDYAHTPDALEKVLRTLRQHTHGKLYCVFGCGGDRDKKKRPLMGEIAANQADYITITNDNPRHEDASLIAEDILVGIHDKAAVHLQLDRAKAIHETIKLASSGDCVLIAGKGAEQYQQIGDNKFPFDDVSHVKLSLSTTSER